MKVLAGLALVFGLAAGAGASTIYQNDFESGNTTGISGVTTITTAPTSVTKFLGPLAAGSSSTLTLTGLAANASFLLNFDLYTLNSLDGSGPGCCQPDSFKLDVNGSTLLNDTFTNNTGWLQTYGGGPGLQVGGTGSDSTLTGTLGYNYYGPDHTYHLSFGVTSDAMGQLVIGFFGNSDQGWDDEGFGIDNIVVSDALPTVPLPAGLPLLAGGLMAFGLLRRRRG